MKESERSSAYVSLNSQAELNTQANIKKSNQVKALFYKNLQLQSKQKCTNICQILTPVICLIFTYLMKELASQALPSGATYENNQYPFVFNNYTLFDLYNKRLEGGKPSKDPLRMINTAWFYYSCIEPACDSTMLGTRDGMNASNPATILGKIIEGNLSIFYQNQYESNESRITSNPFFVNIPSSEAINPSIFGNLTLIQTKDYKYLSKRNGLDVLPDGSFHFITLNSQLMNVSIQVDDCRDLDLHRRNGITKFREIKKIKNTEILAQTADEISTTSGMLSLMDMVAAPYILQVTGKSVRSGWIYMPDTDESKSFVDTIINTVSALIFPLALSLLFPVMLYGIVLEKEEKLIQMMKMNGMRIRNYWLVYFIFNLILCLLTNIVFFALGSFALKTNFFLKTDPVLLTIIALGWSLSQIGLAAFFQTFLNKARSANIIGYLFSIWTMMIASTLSIGVYQVPRPFPVALQFLPPFAFNRLFYLMLTECSDRYCYTNIEGITDEMINCIISLYLGFIVFFSLGAYLYQVLPQEFGVKRHPLFPLIAIYKFITCKNKKLSYYHTERDKELRKYISEDEEDQYSKSQRDFVYKLENTQEYPLVINNLRKLYKKSGYKNLYAAVKSFNLKVAHKETFGLLGPNGAGKTTLISMITGMFQPDYGNAWIGGYDIVHDVSKSQLEMGVCPQFDLLWPQMSVSEHLYFYGRLKGVPSKVLDQKVADAIEEVKLTKFKDFAASALSGGMKRRLSIAISLVGDPKIVFLDEPSTGLDPENRRQLWQVLGKCQQKRALFLTTHMMEQADTLCDRVGIITHGTLRTVENQIKLKKVYGGGYRLCMNLLRDEKKLISADSLHMVEQNHNFDDQQKQQEFLRRSIHDLVQQEVTHERQKMQIVRKKVEAYLKEKYEGAELYKSFNTSLIFKIPSTYKISDIFQQIHEIQKQFDIADLSISESTLEDVFMNVVVKFDKYQEEMEGETTRELKSAVDQDSEEEQEHGKQKMIRENQEQKEQPNHSEKKASIRKNSEEEKFGSVLEKNRQSYMSAQSRVDEVEKEEEEEEKEDSDSSEKKHENKDLGNRKSESSDE